MAGKQLSGDGLSANFAGMSKNQLHDIMSQMKNLIEQNQHQARKILIQNPMLTKALFQIVDLLESLMLCVCRGKVRTKIAQFMLGMVQPPQVIPKIQPPASQNTQQPVQPLQQSNLKPAPLPPGQGGEQDQAGVSQTQIPLSKHQNQPPVAISLAAIPALSHQSQPMPAHSLQMSQQPKGHLPPEMASVSLPQLSQHLNVPRPSLHWSSMPNHQTQVPNASGQLQQPLQAPGFPHMPLQPPLPQNARLSTVSAFYPQHPPQMGGEMGFQHTGTPHTTLQSTFHPGAKPPASSGSTFPQGQTPLLSQPSIQSPYQVGGLHLGPDYGNQTGNAMQVDRGSSWMRGHPENRSQLSGHLGQPSLVRGQMGASNQPPRPAALTLDIEKALLQQVMSLTPEQINILPPEQRNQVLQLQQMLRQ